MQAPRIFVAVLSKDGRVALNFAVSMLATQAALAQHGVGMAMATIDNCTIVGHGRNRLIGQFLLAQDYTHILFIDDDMGWPADAVLRLLAAQEDFVGCTAVRKEGPPARWAAKFKEPMMIDRRGMIRAEGVGACLLLLTRACVEKMAAANEHLQYKDADTGLTLYNLFDTELYNGQLQGNDYVFCRRWTDLGGEIWIDTVPMMEHVGTFTWAGSLARDLAPAQAAE